ncbi:MAG: Unknown protein [uncultured Sulfurovum sp.]|uniref:Peptidase C14 caspase domain-containing protein n=1 Tax=uncultured Sulfurovum sp. TaxID=269237 RepID=A0A6S6TXV9_9BACT|nr:MAG: Unknown protein [uncultured Sulfurovum sp.]
MKVAFICSGDPVDLKYLRENRDSIKKALSSEWRVIYQQPLQNLQDLILTIKEWKDESIEEFLFFYTGHGNVCERKRNLNLKLFYDNKITINDIFDEIAELNPKKTAIVLDACYSGNYNKVAFSGNIQLFTSSTEFQQSFEFTKEDEPKNSVFSHFFCEAIENLRGKITLSDIEKEITPQLEEYFECDIMRDQSPLLISYGNDPIVLVDKTLEEHQKKLQAPYQFIINYLTKNNVTIEKIIESIEKYAKTIVVNALSKHQNINDLITHLADEESFVCVIQDLFKNDDEEIEQWLKEHKKECKSIEQETEARVVIVFTSKRDGQKYDVSFLSNKFTQFNGSVNVDLEDKESKNDLIKRIVDSVRIGNPKVDLILPMELLNEEINLWEAGFLESLSRFSRVRIRYLNRYESNGEIKEYYKIQWKVIEDRLGKHHSLFPIVTLDNLREVGNNMKECGIASTCLFEEQHWNFILQTEVSFIMLWLTKETGEDLTPYYQKLNELEDNYYALNDKPINLMYDNPNDYYYGKGE